MLQGTTILAMAVCFRTKISAIPIPPRRKLGEACSSLWGAALRLQLAKVQGAGAEETVALQSGLCDICFVVVELIEP